CIGPVAGADGAGADAPLPWSGFASWPSFFSCPGAFPELPGDAAGCDCGAAASADPLPLGFPGPLAAGGGGSLGLRATTRRTAHKVPDADFHIAAAPPSSVRPVPL